MKLSVYLNGSHIKDYFNPTFVGVTNCVKLGKSEEFVCVNDDKIALLNYESTACEIDAFINHVSGLDNKEYQKHHEWARLTLWNDMITKKLKWEVEVSEQQQTTGEFVAESIAKFFGFFTI